MDEKRLRELAGLKPEEDRIDEGAILGGLIGLAAGSIIVWLVGELAARKQDRAIAQDLNRLGVETKLKAFPIASMTAQKIKMAVANRVRNVKLAAQLERLESDPEIKAFLSTAVSGQSFKKGKRKAFIALLKKKSDNRTVDQLEKVADEVRGELFKRG